MKAFNYILWKAIQNGFICDIIWDLLAWNLERGYANQHVLLESKLVIIYLWELNEFLREFYKQLRSLICFRFLDIIFNLSG